MTPNRHRFEDVFEFIEKYLAEHGYPPTMRQISEGVGYASPSSAHCCLGTDRRGPSLRLPREDAPHQGLAARP